VTRVLRFSSDANVPLAANAGFQFARRHALSVYGSDSIYSFIPKNACSTIRLSLARANGTIASNDQFKWIHPNNDTFTASLRDLAKARFTFVVLRDPFDRLASVYLDKIVERYPDFWSLHAKCPGNLHPDAFSFGTFVRTICQPGFLRLNIHWRPQSDFLVYQDYDLWVPFERMAQFKDRIEERAGIVIHDARNLTAHGTDQFDTRIEGEFSATPPDEIRVMRKEGKCPTHASLYDDELRTIVRKAYAADFDCYHRRCDGSASER
jgi:hypothetical protein